MDFFEMRFPEDVEYGYSSGTRNKTIKLQTNSGFIQRYTNNDAKLREIQVSDAEQTLERRDLFLDFYNQTNGGLYGFRFKDWNDFTINIDNCAINEDEQLTGSKQVYMFKKYQYNSSYNASYKRIYKPVDNSLFKVYLNGVEQTTYTVDFTKGIIQLSPTITHTSFTITNATNGICNIVGHGLESGDIIYFSNILNALFLNNVKITITKIDDDNFYINEDTSTVNPFVDAQYAVLTKYPQNTDIITFECEYDIPVIFADDYNDFLYNTWNNIKFEPRLQEIIINNDYEDYNI